MSKETITFSSQGASCSGSLLRPNSVEPSPVIILAHGFGSEYSFGLQPFASAFVEMGFTVLLFDYRGFGASEGARRNEVHPWRHIEDWQAAVAYARTLPNINPSKIVLWGSSFSGGHVLATAANDPNICAVIAQVPHTHGLATLFQKSIPDLCLATACAVWDLLRRSIGKPPFMVPVVGKAGCFAAINSPDAWDGYHSLLADGQNFSNEVCALSLMMVPLYSPGKRAQHIHCPTCIIAGRSDTITPFKKAEQTAKSIPHGEFHELPCGHFDVYTSPALEKNLAIHRAFLQTHVL